MVNMVRLLFFAVPFLMTALASSSGETSVETRRAQLSAALQQEWEYELRTYPEMATYIGDNRYNDRLSDYSAASNARELEHARQTLQSIESISTDGFPPQEQLNKLLMVRGLREDIESAGFKDWEMPVNQFGGIHLSYAGLPTAMPFHSVKDYDDYIARLKKVTCRPGWISAMLLTRPRWMKSWERLSNASFAARTNSTAP